VIRAIYSLQRRVPAIYVLLMTDSRRPTAAGLDLGVISKPIKIDTSFVEPFSMIGRALMATSAALMEAGAVLMEARAVLMEARAVMGPLVISLGKAFSDAGKADAALRAGWVPFVGMPIDQFDKDMSSEELHRLLEQYTRDEWACVKSGLWASVESSGVDSEALATYHEALRAHEEELFRSVVRVLFPEIERIARETVYGGGRHEAAKGKQSKGNINTGLRDFREAVMTKLPAGIVFDKSFGLSLPRKMHEHLYQWVSEDEAGLEKLKSDPIPNRHASQHGFVIYSTRHHSFNTLAMAAFMFQLIMRVDAYIKKHSNSRSRSAAAAKGKGKPGA
jgi:hypothetical protein